MVRRVGLTTDFESVRSALDAVTVVGDTSLRDALFLALHTAAPEATRTLLLIFTDGADTSSLLLADEVLVSVRVAAHDQILPCMLSVQMKNAIPGARLAIAPGEAHELPLSNPGAANPIMLAFLRQKPL